MSASLAFQTAARAILIANSAVTALIPAGNIIDANGRPELLPRINVGEDQEVPATQGDQYQNWTKLFATLHIWNRELGLDGVKAIAYAVRRALAFQSWTQIIGANSFRCIDTRLQSARYLRDPDGQTAHAVVTFQAIIQDQS